MSFNIIKVYGDNNTWIGFLGTYLGSIISGLVTFFGVLLTIKFTEEEGRKDKLPEKINNVEECLDYIEDIIEELRGIKRKDTTYMDFQKNSRPPKRYYLFRINYNYELVETEDFNKLLSKEHRKKIRNYTVNINTEAYCLSKKFNISLDENFKKYILPLKQKLQDFQWHIISNYDEAAEMVFNTNVHKLQKIKLSEEDTELLQDNYLLLHHREIDYAYALTYTYEELKMGLEDILDKLMKEFND